MMNEVRINETRFKGTYLLEDSGVNYIYDEKTNDLHVANNLELSFYSRRSNSNDWNYEDNWRYGDN